MVTLVEGSMYMDGMMAIMYQTRGRTVIPIAVSIILELMTKAFIVLRLDRTFVINVFDKALTLKGSGR